MNKVKIVFISVLIVVCILATSSTASATVSAENEPYTTTEDFDISISDPPDDVLEVESSSLLVYVAIETDIVDVTAFEIVVPSLDDDDEVDVIGVVEDTETESTSYVVLDAEVSGNTVKLDWEPGIIAVAIYVGTTEESPQTGNVSALWLILPASASMFLIYEGRRRFLQH